MAEKSSSTCIENSKYGDAMDFIGSLKGKYNLQLNEQQVKAVQHIHGPLLLIAVPGAGKTTVMVCRLANMILNHGINPANILTLTFSRASARDMKDRFERLFGRTVRYKLDLSTIHSFSYMVIDDYVKRKGVRFPMVIEDEESVASKYNLLRQIYQTVNQDILSDDKLDELVSTLSFVKNMMIKPADFEQYDFDIENFEQIYIQYEQFKKENRYIDYDDMLVSALVILRNNPGILRAFRERYPYINVDESQDTSLVQHEIIRLLAAPLNNIFMVGDEDQSIYRFRGADPKSLLEFRNTYPGAKVYLMEQNFRSTSNIVNAANRFIKHNKARYQKNMQTARDEGDPIEFKFFEEKSEQYKYLVDKLLSLKDTGDAAVLFRNNLSCVALADAFDRVGIRFYLREARTYFFKHWVTKDIISFLKLAMDGTDREAFEQVYFKMNGYLSKQMMDFIKTPKYWGGNVFEALLSFPKLYRKQAQTIVSLKQTFSLIKNAAPIRALEIIEDKLNYGQYLKEAGKKLGYSFESLNQILNSLKNIALHTKAIDAFIVRIDELQRVMQDARNNKSSCTLTLSTIHSSKGLEFDHVYIVDLFDEQLPTAGSIENMKRGFPEEMEEEIRLFYVAATRAKNRLELLSSKFVNGNLARPSRFISMLLGSPNEKSLHQADVTAERESSYMAKDQAVVQEVAPDSLVRHIKFGLGKVVQVDRKNDIITVNFEEAGIKKLSMRACIKTGILRCIETKSS